MALTRREFILRSFGAFGAATLAFERFGLLNALAQSTDYKALVCIFLFGGNDSGNMIIPYDDYASYANVRESSGLALPQSVCYKLMCPVRQADLDFIQAWPACMNSGGRGK